MRTMAVVVLTRAAVSREDQISALAVIQEMGLKQ
jgi:hypothetical protein